MISAQARQGVEGEMMKTRSANFALSGWKGSCWLELSRICQQFLVDLSPIQVLIGSIGLVGNSLSIYIFSTVGMMMMIRKVIAVEHFISLVRSSCIPKRRFSKKIQCNSGQLAQCTDPKQQTNKHNNQTAAKVVCIVRKKREPRNPVPALFGQNLEKYSKSGKHSES